jgi:hypothetical protein
MFKIIMNWTLPQAVFFYRLTAQIEKAVQKDPGYSIAGDADFSAFIHDA